MSPPPHLSGASDQEVVAWARQGREEVYRELLRRYQDPVYTRIYRMVRDPELAKDLTQETFIKVFQALDRHPPERNFAAWIFRIANNATVDYIRRKELTPAPLENPPDTTPPGKIKSIVIPVAERTDSAPARVRARKLAPAIEQAIGRLRPEYRQCVVLRVIEERSYADIAEIMNLPPGTVSTYLHRAKKQLKEMLGPLLDALPLDSTPTPA